MSFGFETADAINLSDAYQADFNKENLNIKQKKIFGDSKAVLSQKFKKKSISLHGILILIYLFNPENTLKNNYWYQLNEELSTFNLQLANRSYNNSPMNEVTAPALNRNLYLALRSPKRTPPKDNDTMIPTPFSDRKII